MEAGTVLNASDGGGPYHHFLPDWTRARGSTEVELGRVPFSVGIAPKTRVARPSCFCRHYLVVLGATQGNGGCADVLRGPVRRS